MKRILFLFVALFLCANINAQIQSKFWGLELGKQYTIDEAKSIIGDKCSCSFREDNAITAFWGNFGGYQWEIIKFLFSNYNSCMALYGVEFFSSPCETEDCVLGMYFGLLRALISKYGIPEDQETDRGFTHSWQDKSSPRGCSLSREKAEAQSGQVSYYIRLSYWDANHLITKQKIEHNEL